MLFLLWLSLFILSGAISLLFSSSILGTFQPGESIFQCHIFLPFHTLHGILKARILKWFAIPFSSGRHSAQLLHHDPPILEIVSRNKWYEPLPTSTGSLKKQESSRKTSISALMTMPKPLTVRITINYGKFWNRWEYQATWPASWEIYMQVRKQQLELDMEQQTCSK